MNPPLEPASIARKPRGLIVWLTGLSGSGKSTLARGVLAELGRAGIAAELLDADRMRAHLAAELGFTRADREANVRRLGFVAGLLSRHGVVAVVAAMSPYREGRESIRAQTAARGEGFVEVFVDAPVELCEQRDPVGLYRRFRAGAIQHLSGLDEPYEPPPTPEVHCRTGQETVEQSVARVMAGIALGRNL